MGKLTHYKLRYKRWRADTGSAEWHELTAALRAFEGQHFIAGVHRFLARFKRFMTQMAEMIEEFDLGKAIQ